MKILRYIIFFLIGSAGYGAIELLWRGRTHWAMLLAGGICFIIFSDIAKRYAEEGVAFKIFLSAVSVTAVEVIFGVVFNIVLEENIWDYSDLPLNFMGQICLLYSVLWGGLALLLMPVADKLNKKIIGQEKS